MHTYEYPRPALTVDLVVLCKHVDEHLYVLMVERGKEPFRGRLALPGGFFDDNDASTAVAAARELEEETGFKTTMLPELLGVYSEVARDPRERVVSVAYVTMVPRLTEVKAGDDARDARWVRLMSLKTEQLAFDHVRILGDALTWYASRRFA